MSDDYIRQRLSSAMDALAVSTASLQMRLASAGIVLVILTDDDFASLDDRALYQQIMDTLTRHGAGGEMGKIEASARELDDVTALAVAGQIRDLHHRFFPLLAD